MRILRVAHQGHVFYASLQEQSLICLNKELGYTGPIPLADVAVMPPAAPTKVVCAAYNYPGQAQAAGREDPPEPIFYFKPPSAVIGAGNPVALPETARDVRYEPTLAVIIGQNCRHVAPDAVGPHIFGYACAADLVDMGLAADPDRHAQARAADTFLPIGPWIETEPGDIAALPIKVLVDGHTVCEGQAAEMRFSPTELVSAASMTMTLMPGDVLLTGSPCSVGPLAVGQELRLEMAPVGILINETRSQAPAPESGAVQ
jgi:2-keto-4-pentenoate hydratase/2-oxohepta-3-ene-1,7-dioic acid hydratase in catechol pathway